MHRSILQAVILGCSLLALSLLPRPAMAVTDADFDGIPDSLELALAQRFFPTLNLHCGSYEGLPFADRRQLYGHTVDGYPNSSNGKIPFVVRPFSPGTGSDCNEPFHCLEIRYGMAWNWDLGDDTAGGSHRGDSEFYAILVARKDTDGSQWGVTWDLAKNDANQWRLMKEFMSAHWGVPGDSSSYRAHGNDGATGPQRVWCSEGKHGMYQTQSACNNGGYADADDCSDNRCDIRADILPDLLNIGEQPAPLNQTIPYPAASKTASPSGNYQVWSGLKFGDSGDFKSKMLRPLLWCTAYNYCLPHCLARDPVCPPGDLEVGDCSGECGVRPADGVLCQAVKCY
jgi:hypothetical protein